MDNVLKQNAVIPFFFEKSSSKLYGCHHQSLMKMNDKPFVVICSPIGQEYIRCHRALYNLAINLAREGYDVLRFDYTGCGDSEGDFENGALSQWEEDVRTAIDEMRFRCNHSEAILIGLRLGGTLAAGVAAGDRKVRKLALWEPVINGYAYLNEIRLMQNQFVNYLRPRNRQLFQCYEGHEEIIGFLMNNKLISELEGINSKSLKIPVQSDKMILLNGSRGDQDEYVQHFINTSDRFDVFFCDEPKLWNVQLFKRITPVNTIKEIINWVKRA